MKMHEIDLRIENYLHSEDTRPRIVNLNSRASIVAFRTRFDVGNAVFKTPADYSRPDEDLMMENLYAEIQTFKGNLFLIGFTSHLRLKGREALRQFLSQIAHMTLVSGKLVLVCFACADMLRFEDSRLRNLVYLADGAADSFPRLRFVGKDIPLPAGLKAGDGIDKAGMLLESVNADPIVIRTKKTARDYRNSMISIEALGDAYDALAKMDPATGGLSRALGKAEQWVFALSEMGPGGNWSDLVTRRFGSPNALELSVGKWDEFSDDERWLYFIALKLFGARRNACLDTAAREASSPGDMTRKVYRAILDMDCHAPDFPARYRERKQLLQQMFDVEDDAEVIDYIKMTKRHTKDAIRYLTDNTKLEKEAIIDLISAYAQAYTGEELREILLTVYPDLAAYLDAYVFPEQDWLGAYFTAYRYCKVTNHIAPELREMAQRQAIDHDFLKLPPRITVVDRIKKDGTFLYFVDAMGAEFVPYIARKCRTYDLKMTVTLSRCELPSLTRFNKDFFESYPIDQRAKVSELDDIIHHGKENYDYQVTKTPLHLIRELEIIDDVLKNARAKLLSSAPPDRVLLTSDHGATRMAVINEHIIDIDVNAKGTNGGRVCEWTPEVQAVPFAISEGGYAMLASYDRFKGGKPANVEAHGGATPEEVVVPVITLSLATTDVEVQVITRVVEYSFKQPPVLKLFSKSTLADVRVRVNEKWYKADDSADGQNFSFTLTGLKKGQYTAALYADGNEVAAGLTFELKSKVGSSTSKNGIL